MKIKTVIFGLLLIGQLSCSDDSVEINEFKDDTSITTLNGTWKVTSFEDYSSGQIEYKTIENSRNLDIIVTFNDRPTPKQLTGTNTTNEISGEFDQVGQRQFKVTNFSTTEVAQPEWADKFTNAILDGNITFKINRSQLRIYYENQNKSVTLTSE